MQRLLRQRVEVDVCSQCQGMWLDPNELAQFVGSWKDLPRHGQPVPPPAGAALTCPRCDCRLQRRSYSEKQRTIIDHCGNCGGIWLDRGELERILDEVYGLAG